MGSSKRAALFLCEGDAVVKLLTMDVESETFRGVRAVASVIRGGNGCSSLGDSGEKEGKEVRDLSDEAIDEAELDM